MREIAFLKKGARRVPKERDRYVTTFPCDLQPEEKSKLTYFYF